MKDRESWLEVGLVLLIGGVLIGVGVLAFGRASGSMQHTAGHAQEPPGEGEVPANRHQHISTVAAR
jgi:hypothetical protein